jgi:hypothetical protein
MKHLGDNFATVGSIQVIHSDRDPDEVSRQNQGVEDQQPGLIPVVASSKTSWSCRRQWSWHGNWTNQDCTEFTLFIQKLIWF